jgi:hypothetical protein
VKRVPAVAAGLVAGLSLIGIGEGMHLLSGPVHAVLHRGTTLAAAARKAAAPAVAPRADAPADLGGVARPAVTSSVPPTAPSAPPARLAHRRRAVKMASVDESNRADGARTRSRPRREAASGRSLFGLRFKWGGDTFAHRD